MKVGTIVKGGTIVDNNEVVDDTSLSSMEVHQLLLLRNVRGDEHMDTGSRSFPSWSFKTS